MVTRLLVSKHITHAAAAFKLQVWPRLAPEQLMHMRQAACVWRSGSVDGQLGVLMPRRLLVLPKEAFHFGNESLQQVLNLHTKAHEQGKGYHIMMRWAGGKRGRTTGGEAKPALFSPDSATDHRATLAS